MKNKKLKNNKNLIVCLLFKAAVLNFLKGQLKRKMQFFKIQMLNLQKIFINCDEHYIIVDELGKN